jgi:hypothetical protein
MRQMSATDKGLHGMEVAGQGLGKWARPGVPHKGWRCVDIEDLGERSATCEMCETHEIRYVHYMEHQTYPQTLGCGCVCAGHMEDDYEGARQREKTMRNAGARRRRWLTRNWRTSRKGNLFLNAEGYNIVVYPTGQNWSFCVTNRESNRAFSSRLPLPSLDAAKLRAFDALVWVKQRDQ